MFNLILLVSVAVPAASFAFDARRKPAQRIALSHFWYFTLIWMAAFPLRGWLVLNHDRVSQVVMTGAMPNPEATQIAAALAVVFAYWLATLGGYRSPVGNLTAVEQKDTTSPLRVIAVGAIWLLLSAGVLLYLAPGLEPVMGAAYHQARMGHGLLWMLPELCVPAVIAFLAYLLVHPGVFDRRLIAAILFGAFLLALFVGISFFSRRIVAAVLFGIVAFVVALCRRLWLLGAMAVVGSVLGAGIFELVRYIPVALMLTDTQSGDSGSALARIVETVLSTNFLLYFSTSFEGAEHVARLLDRASSWQLWTGIDHGITWFFNLGGSYIPRAIWDGKPLIYGGLEQMAWLYPSYLKDGFLSTAIPTSFVVDFAFGFGLPFGLILAFFLGRYLRVCEEAFWNRAGHPATLGFSLITLIFMFNVVRGGTAIGQTLVVFAVIAASMFGLRATVRAVWHFISDTFGLLGSRIKTPSERVFFYPHRYLRERQLDTIRSWPAAESANPELFQEIRGGQVSRQQALAPTRRSWKQTLPLLNLKCRPANVPKDCAVYVWGGLIMTGPFIVDIDNPYAFTAYNVFATRIYRPVIRWFLESPRCLQVRCLSQACRDGLRELYGDTVAAKAAVAYPAMAPKVTAVSAAESGRCRFLFVATQFEIKGGPALVRAFRQVVVAYPEANLDLVTHLPEEFADLVNSCPGVTVHDAHFTRDEIANQFMRKSDVLVHPTYFDSFGMVVLEAMAHGLPVIATGVYAIPEMIEDGVNGILVDSPVSIWRGIHPSPLFSDTDKVRAAARTADTQPFERELSSAMLSLARDPERRRAAGQASLARVEKWIREWPTL